MASDNTQRPDATEPVGTEEKNLGVLGARRVAELLQHAATRFVHLRRPPPSRQRIKGHEAEPAVGGESLEDCLQAIRIQKLERDLAAPEACGAGTSIAKSEQAGVAKPATGDPENEWEEATRLHMKNGNRERDRERILRRQTVVDSQGRRNGEPLLSDPTSLFGQVRLERKRGGKRRQRRPSPSGRHRFCDQLLDADLHQQFLKALLADCREQALGPRKDTLQLELVGLLIEQFRKRPEGPGQWDLERYSPTDIGGVIELGLDAFIRRGNNKLVAERLNTTNEEVEKCVKRFDRTVVRVAKAVLEQSSKEGGGP